MNSLNACCQSVQKLLSPRLLAINSQIKICKTIILPVGLYGSKTWSLTSGQEHRLRIFAKNGVRKGIFAPKKDETIGGWRILHN
jgi:hypothetical protein